MSNQLVPQELLKGSLVNLEDFDAAVSAGDGYLKRIQLYGSKSDAVAEGIIGQGRYGLVDGDDIVDLGETIDVVIVAFHPKALQSIDGNVITNFDIKSEEYQRIKQLSKTKDSGCMHGPEFLLWIPPEGIFATYFMANATARREAKKVRPLVGHGATFACKLCSNAKFKWHGPVVTPCSASMEMPETSVMEKTIEGFLNPPESEIETAEEDTSGRER